jgi:hypothetical protein
MKKHLGRNPFDKAKNSSNKSKPNLMNENKTSTMEWLLIQLPAKALMFALKTGILVKSAIEKKSH